MSDDVVYANKTMLFTLKGSIAVQFMDGEVLEGEFASQDAYNVFVKVDGEPLMIPRQQIRFIRGLQGQTIEKDTSAERPDAAHHPNIPTQPLPERGDQTSVRATLPSADSAADYPHVNDDDDDGTLILTPTAGTPAKVEETEETNEGTIVLPNKEDYPELDFSDDDDGTMVIGVDDLPPLPEQDSAAFVDDEDDEFDMTMVFQDKAADEALEADDDATAFIAPPKSSATLTVIGGPHSGQSFELGGNITTIGRASDNVVTLSSDKEISRHHAIVLQEGNRFVIQDQNSLNGTFVNNDQITDPRYLEAGDIILVGVSTLKYEE